MTRGAREIATIAGGAFTRRADESATNTAGAAVRPVGLEVGVLIDRAVAIVILTVAPDRIARFARRRLNTTRVDIAVVCVGRSAIDASATTVNLAAATVTGATVAVGALPKEEWI